MIYLLTFAFCLPSAVFMVMNAEAWVITNSLLGNAEPIPLGLSAAAAQIVCYAVVYFHGPRLLDLMPRLRTKLDTWSGSSERYLGWSYGALFVGATVGVPPALFFTFLRRQFGYRFPAYICICGSARIIRFLTLALLPATFQRLFAA